jgi:hypothetical protein
MIHQLEMTLTAGKPEVNEWEVGLLVILLEDIGGWATGAELVERIGMPATESSKRIIRAMAEASGGAIISGQLGYKATGHATPEEIHHATAWYRSQAAKMFARADAIERKAHQVGG